MAFYSIIISFFIFITSYSSVYGQNFCEKGEEICGKWISVEKNIIIKVSKVGDEFKATLVWFKNDNPKKDLYDYLDDNNPNKSLQKRKVIGIDLVKDLFYHSKNNSWENGKIYDPVHGRIWDSSAVITKEGILKVTGYWKFKWIGKSLAFERLPESYVVNYK